jgi:hypothetical protein
LCSLSFQNSCSWTSWVLTKCFRGNCMKRNYISISNIMISLPILVSLESTKQGLYKFIKCRLYLFQLHCWGVLTVLCVQ